MSALAIDLFCGLGGWTEGLLAESYDVIGFDIERHEYSKHRYPAQLVLQDVLTLHGSQFRDAALIVASPPCQEFSYMAMPWSKAKAKRAAILADPAERKRLTALFDACFRIQREAIEAAGHFIPLVVENVRGANEWVGRSRWNYGSFHLWGDVPALMPMTKRLPFKGGNRNIGRASGEHKWNTEFKVPGFRFDGRGKSFQTASVEETGHKSQGLNWSNRELRGQDFTRVAGKQNMDGRKNNDGSWFAIGSPGQKETGRNPVHELAGIKNKDDDGYERNHPHAFGWKTPRTNSKSPARKAASAAIARIPFALAQYIARVYRPFE